MFELFAFKPGVVECKFSSLPGIIKFYKNYININGISLMYVSCLVHVYRCMLVDVWS